MRKPLRYFENSDELRSSVDEVYDRILMRIINGDLNVGEAITSTRLACELNVSRTPVVSAIDRLVTDGILVKEKNRRARVRHEAKRWLLYVHEMREIVEPPAARLAAKHLTEDALHQLESQADLAMPCDEDDWLEEARRFDFALHLTIADHCGNPQLCETIHRCWNFKRLSYQLGCSNPEIEEQGYREHLSILAALAHRDQETAYADMLFHLRSSLLLTQVQQIV